MINTANPRPAASYAILLLLTMMLAGCGSQPGKPVPGSRTADIAQPMPAALSLQELLLAAERSSGPQADEFRLRAAQQALSAGNPELAQYILNLVSADPTPALLLRLIGAEARLALLLEQPQAALRWLADPRLLDLPQTSAEQLTLGQLRAEAYLQAHSYLASARERIFFDALLDEPGKALNHDQIFDALMSIPTQSLVSQAERAITSDLRGWLSLAAMTRQYQADPLQQLQALEDWRKAWSHHPAANRLPMSLQLLSQVVRDQPKSIALLLPLQGDLGVYGRAIRDGILASHYQRHGQAVIKMFDTSSIASADLPALLERAKAAGAELAIGPLARDKVTALAQLPQLPMPVLALNRSFSPAGNPDLYQFGLLPEDEINQIADQVFSEGKRNALVLYPAGDWGYRNFQAFESRWLGLGGNIIDNAQYANQRDYSDLIKTLLAVEQSEKRATDLRRITGERFEFTPRRRADIDFVFLLANPAQARGINPTLAFYYADDIPVYATSHVHESNDSRIESIDLNGIRFCDIPWKLTDNNPLQSAIKAQWPAAGTQLAAFYALGVDAYQLQPRLQQMAILKNSKLHGVTGVLQLSADQVITRTLLWARFANGRVITDPLSVDTLVEEDMGGDSGEGIVVGETAVGEPVIEQTIVDAPFASETVLNHARARDPGLAAAL
jgi:outer membrane PBP1 activator LpoA protein